jgi:hypothetical protein
MKIPLPLGREPPPTRRRRRRRAISSPSRWQVDRAEDLELDWGTSDLEYCDRRA